MRRGLGLNLCLDIDTTTESGHDYSQILPYLFLGTASLAADPQTLAKLNITRVVNCATLHRQGGLASSTRKTPSSGCAVLSLPVTDDTASGPVIAATFAASHEFIATSRAEGTACLVCCQAGMSRSATHVIAFLMAYLGMRLAEALQHVRECRPVASPNDGFMAVLLQLDEQLFGDASIDMDIYRNDRFSSAEELSCMQSVRLVV